MDLGGNAMKIRPYLEGRTYFQEGWRGPSLTWAWFIGVTVTPGRFPQLPSLAKAGYRVGRAFSHRRWVSEVQSSWPRGPGLPSDTTCCIFLSSFLLWSSTTVLVSSLLVGSSSQCQFWLCLVFLHIQRSKKWTTAKKKKKSLRM